MTNHDKVIVSYSELSTWRDCPLKHALAYRQRWRVAEPDAKRSRGTLWHTVMETHYKVIERWQHSRKYSGYPFRDVTAQAEANLLKECRRHVLPCLLNPETGELYEQSEIVAWMYEGYVAKYGADLDWEVVAIEQEVLEPLPALNGRGSSRRYFITAKIDLIVRDRLSKYWVVDHKSCDNLPGKTELQLDDQFGLYNWIMRQRGMPVLGSIHSAARTRRNKGDENGTRLQPLSERFARTHMFRTPRELDNIAMDAVRTAQASRNLDTPPHSSPNPMQCKWKCDFLEVHLAMRRGIPAHVALQDFGFTRSSRGVDMPL